MKKTSASRTSSEATEASKQERGADRFDTELPVDLDGVGGLTRNISATGIYFELGVEYETGDRVHFTVEMMVRGKKKNLICDGEVVRVDRKGPIVGIATRLVESFFDDEEDVNISSN